MDYLIALGGNIGDTAAVFQQALDQISTRIGSVLQTSRWYETEPLLCPENPVLGQRNYLNGAARFRSELEAEEVLKRLMEIEELLGRSRPSGAPRWGPRVLDLDLIAAEGSVLETPALVLPHPEMHKRRFVLEPLLEVAPDWVHPLLGKTVREMLDAAE